MNGITNELIKREINYLTREDDGFPERLKRIPSSPKGIYYMGELPDENVPSVAIIGARNCSGYGRQMAREFALEIAGAGIQVISGMAMGVDGIAQNAALSAGGRSFAVLGGGVDICYPAENAKLYERLLDNGAVISEYAPGTPTIGRNFASRNRIISGLSDAVLVIEARQRSGTLITVGFALDQGKDVYALPGRVNDSLSLGCNELIKDGAYPLIRPYDFVCEFMDRYAMLRSEDGNEPHDDEKRLLKKTVNDVKATDIRRFDINAGKKQGGRSEGLRFLSTKERLIISVLDHRPKTVSEIFYDLSDRDDISITELLGLLTDMTVKHKIDCIDGMNYCIRS